MAERIQYIGDASKPKKKAKQRKNKAFYSSRAWKDLRLCKLSIDPVCEHCCEAFADHVHHVKEVSDFPELRLVLENLESCCNSCHSKHHAKQQKQKPTLPIWEG